MKLSIASSDRDHAILICDEDHNDIAEFFHNEHATVPQSYETALALAKKLVDAPQEWQPIETARLDGKPFLARYQWLGESRLMVIRRSNKGPWWIMDGTSQTVGNEKDAIQFTDWMPLPDTSSISRPERCAPTASSPADSALSQRLPE